jgi:hypothetical protein
MAAAISRAATGWQVAKSQGITKNDSSGCLQDTHSSRGKDWLGSGKVTGHHKVTGQSHRASQKKTLLSGESSAPMLQGVFDQVSTQPCPLKRPTTIAQIQLLCAVQKCGPGLLKHSGTVQIWPAFVCSFVRHAKVENPSADPPLYPDGKLAVGVAVGTGEDRSCARTQTHVHKHGK